MASRSMYTHSDQLSMNKSAEMSSYAERFTMSFGDYQLNFHNSWLNSFVKSFDTSRVNPFQSSCIDFKANSKDSIHSIFTFIDLCNFLILCIKRENEIITNITCSNYKSTINYHKIKEIDFIKLLLVIRDKIDLQAEKVQINDSCFTKEVSLRIDELEEILKNCFFSQINDIDVTEKFNLSSLMVDAIIDDCNVDLWDLDKTILRIQQEWEKKCPNSRTSKNRIERLLGKLSDSLENDVIKHLHTIGITLERLLSGYSNTIFNVAHLELTKEFLLEFHTEIDGRQYESIVNLKHFHLELEQKTLGLILELKESQILSLLPDQNTNEFHCNLSPIKSTTVHHGTPIHRNKPSVLTSTPSLVSNMLRKNTSEYAELISEGDELSIRSMDSGILPMSDHPTSSTTSIDTFDAPLANRDCDKEAIDIDSDGLGSMSIWSESDASKSMSVTNISDCNLVESSNNTSQNMGFLDGLKKFENYEAIINYLQIPLKQREELRQKIIKLCAHQETNTKFNCALSVTVFNYRNNPFDDLTLTLTHLEQRFFDFVRTDIQEISSNHKWTSNLDIQNNNSACSPNFVSTFVSDFNDNQNDRNTNNNADSKEDDLSSLNTPEDDILNNLSIYADNGEQLAFTVSDSPSSEVIINKITNSNILSDIEDANSATTDANWQRYDLLMAKRSHENGDGSLILEDIDLALKLSELHLRSEFDYEEQRENTFVASRKKFVAVQDDTFASDIPRDNQQPFTTDYMNQPCDTIAEIDEELQTDCPSQAVVDISLEESSENSVNKSLSLNVTHDSDTLSFSERISLTMTLADRLLSLTKHRMEHISSLFKTMDRSNLARIASSKMSSIYAARKRLAMISKIFCNLRYSIQCSYYSPENPDYISLIDKLMKEADNISKFSFKLEEWIHKSDLSMENIEETSYMNELPDNLLVKLDPIDTDSILLMSGQRLCVTVAALERYPCYDRLMKSSLSRIIELHDPIIPRNLELDIKTPNTNSELTVEVHKLRRITAICALNIVDLHVIIMKMEENCSAECKDKVSKLKELLLFWRIVDKECHRLLRCNSLIQHVLVDTRRTYVELVSLTAVIISIMRTVTLSTSEINVLKRHMDNIHSYKLRLVEWLDEVELCSSVVHKKRITNRRFKFYEDIHNYLEENLNSVSELAKHIKLGCHQTVETLTGILTYCSNLSSTSVTDIDSVLCTSATIDNRHLNMDNNCNSQICEGVLGAGTNLETIENNLCQLQDLLDKNKEIFTVTSGDNQYFEWQKTGALEKRSVDVKTLDIESNVRGIGMLENATLDLTEKISSIATVAASRAILFYVDEKGAENRTDVDTDQQLSNWTSLSQNDNYLDDAVEQIVDDITAIMTASLFENMQTVDKAAVVLESYKLVLSDICLQLRDRTLHFLIENIILDRQGNDDGFVSESGGDLAEYFSEEMSHLLVNGCIQTVALVEPPAKNQPCIDLCVGKLQRRLSQKLLDKTVFYIANFVGSFLESSRSSLGICQETSSQQHVTEELDDLPIPIATYRLWKKINQELFNPVEILTKMTKTLQTDMLSLRNYRCDIRKPNNRGIWKFIKKPISKPDLPPSRLIASEKISKLVAQFDGGMVEQESTVKSRVSEVATTIISTKSIERTTVQIVKELINDIIEELPLEDKVSENVEQCNCEFVFDSEEIEGQCAKVFNYPSDLYATESYGSPVFHFSDFGKMFPVNRKRKCSVGLFRTSAKRHTSSDQQCLLSVSENVPDFLEIVDHIREPGVSCRENLPSSLSVESERLLTSEGSSSMTISQYSALLIKDFGDTVDDNRDVEDSSTVPSCVETVCSHQIVQKSTLSDQPVLNSTEIECCPITDTAVNIQVENSERQMSPFCQKSVFNPIIEQCTNHSKNQCQISKIDDDEEDNQDKLDPPIGNGSQCPSHVKKYTWKKSSYEQSLSTLWIVVFVIFVVLVLSLVCHDHFSDICQCLRNRQSILPRIVSSTLPF